MSCGQKRSMSSQLEKDVARNKKIVAYILELYGVNNPYTLPPIVSNFVVRLQRDIDKAEAWLGPVEAS
ncbi:hypothetical protein ES708_10407 [subsurface metagenome]